ncbi:MAG: hypothetical protein FWC46_02955, partial [Actinomycetia bacterium]|nr:hypothetical protein [Actinomycetes bacterium]
AGVLALGVLGVLPTVAATANPVPSQSGTPGPGDTSSLVTTSEPAPSSEPTPSVLTTSPVQPTDQPELPAGPVPTADWILPVGGGVPIMPLDDPPSPPHITVPDLIVSKTVAPGFAPGNVVTYTIVVSNFGWTADAGWTMVDTLPPDAGMTPVSVTVDPVGAADCAISGLDVTCTGAPLDAWGNVVFTLEASTSPTAAACVTNQATATVADTQTEYDPADNQASATTCPATVALTKTPTPDVYTASGQAIDYAFTVTNTSDPQVDPLMQVRLTDDDLPGLVWTAGLPGCAVQTDGSVLVSGATPGTLAPGESVTCHATWTTGSPAVGDVPNTARVVALFDDTILHASASALIVARNPDLGVTKSASAAFTPGDPIEFTVTVTNHGEAAALAGWTLTDDLRGVPGVTSVSADPQRSGDTCGVTGKVVTCTGAALEPGASATFIVTVGTAPSVAGCLTNQASVAVVDSQIDLVADDDTATADSCASLLTLTKAVDPGVYVAAGDVLHFTITATNDSGRALTDVLLSDDLAGLQWGTCTLRGGPDIPVPTVTPVPVLNPGQSFTCEATYAVVDADLGAGSVVNTVTADYVDWNGTPRTADAQATAQLAGVTLDKTAEVAHVDPATGVTTPGLDRITAAGDVVTYIYTVSNTGRLPLHGLTLTDPAATATVPGFTGVGTLDLSALVCQDGGGTTVALGAITLESGGVVTCRLDYTVLPGDMEPVALLNAATVTGLAPGQVPVTDDASVATPVVSSPALALVKTVTPSAGPAAIGAELTYTITLTNPGNVALRNVVLTDTFNGTDGPLTLDCTVAPDGATDAGDPYWALVASGDAPIVCTATYVVAQADAYDEAVADGLVNQACTQGWTPLGVKVGPVCDDVTTPVVAAPAIGVVKALDPAFPAPAGGYPAGGVAHYLITATNTGDVTLTDVAVTDELLTGEGAAPTVTCPTAAAGWPDGAVGRLAPGHSVTCQATYTVVQADIDSPAIQRDGVQDRAGATGVDPGGDPVHGTSNVVVIRVAAGLPAMSVVKTGTVASLDNISIWGADEVIHYTVTVTNTGTLTLRNVKVDDSSAFPWTTDPAAPGFSGAGTFALLCPATTILAPGAQLVCTGDYTAVQADMDLTAISNRARATATTDRGDSLSGASLWVVQVRHLVIEAGGSTPTPTQAPHIIIPTGGTAATTGTVVAWLSGGLIVLAAVAIVAVVWRRRRGAVAQTQPVTQT